MTDFILKICCALIPRHLPIIDMNVTGKLNEKDAGIVAKRYTVAAILIGVAALVAAASLWFR